MTGDGQDYFLRVRPSVGEALFSKRLWVWNLDYGYLAAEALARTGLSRQRWFADPRPAGGALCLSLGQHHRGQPAAEALARHCRDHNHFAEDWDLRWCPQEPQELANALGGSHQPDLLLALGDANAAAVARAAIDHGVPLVMGFVPRSGSIGAIQLVWHPRSAVDPAAVIQICEALSQVPALDLNRPEHHFDGLEVRSWGLALAKWILLRDEVSRPDLEQPIIRRGRALLVRGQPDWPWAVRAVGPDRLPDLLALAGSGPGRFSPSLAMIRGQRVLVLGLGTASLFCAEAAQLARRMVFVDFKQVTAVNPVRQVYSTRHVGRPKAEALAEILGGRVVPQGDWERRQDGPIDFLVAGSRALGAVQLHLRVGDKDAVDRLDQILDRFRPTLAVVGMGRTRNDNFVATAALRRRGIRHVTPSAFPGVTHFKHVLTDGAEGPCYDCIQGHLSLDSAPGPTLSPEQRDLFYGGSQPASLVETLPSSHSLLRLAFDLSQPRGARPAYLLRELAAQRPCFVGANQVERLGGGDWLYGVDQPFSMVTFGVEDLIDHARGQRCSCGRINGMSGG